MIDREEAQEMRLEGATYQEIADRFLVTRQRVHQFLSGYRSPAEAKTKNVLTKRILRRIRQDRVKNIVLAHYGNGKLACVKCGFSDVRALSIDHINGDGWKERHLGGGINLYCKLIAGDYPEGYQTLCMNCQFIKREENREYRS